VTDPITPPPELVQQWWYDFNGAFYEFEAITAKVFQAGADQELEACCEQLRRSDWTMLADDLRAARRPKPPSLKEQAIAELDDAVMRGDCITVSDALPTIRRALEALPND
jgi:hypothetical protein